MCKLRDIPGVTRTCPRPNVVQGEMCTWVEQSSDSGRGLSWDGSSPGFDARPAHARWHPAMSPLGADSGFCNLGLCEEVWRGNWLHEEADSSQDQLGGTRLLPALHCDIPAFLSLSNRLLRRCVPADFLKVPGWMSPTKAQAATSRSAQWEEGRVLSVTRWTRGPLPYSSLSLSFLPFYGEETDFKIFFRGCFNFGNL